MVTSNAKYSRKENEKVRYHKDKNSQQRQGTNTFGGNASFQKEMEVDGELFLEKLEAKKRFEREIKIKKKRTIEEHIQKEKKPQEKRKRMKNIDLTKGYEYGLFDDDEYYDQYMK